MKNSNEEKVKKRKTTKFILNEISNKEEKKIVEERWLCFDFMMF